MNQLRTSFKSTPHTDGKQPWCSPNNHVPQLSSNMPPHAYTRVLNAPTHPVCDHVHEVLLRRCQCDQAAHCCMPVLHIPLLQQSVHSSQYASGLEQLLPLQRERECVGFKKLLAGRCKTNCSHVIRHNALAGADHERA